MKISLRGMGSPELLGRLERSGATKLVGGIRGGLFFETCWPDPRLGEFLGEAARLGPVDLNPWMTFTRAEVEQASFLRPRCRKVLTDSAQDFERMRADLDSLPWRGDDPLRRFRLPAQVSLTRIRLAPNQIAAVGQWSAEYVMPHTVRAVFEKAGLTGMEVRPVIHTRTSAPVDDYHHLYSENLLGPRHLDVASPALRSAHPEEQGYDAMGCLCYPPAALARALDFNRTGERIVSFEFPDWVVRAPVRACFREHGLRGWAFEPVLEVGTELYARYDSLWTSFFRLLEECGEHTIRSQPPPCVA